MEDILLSLDTVVCMGAWRNIGPASTRWWDKLIRLPRGELTLSMEQTKGGVGWGSWGIRRRGRRDNLD